MFTKPKTEVYWHAFKKPQIKVLKEDRKANVVIIGGGMAGLMCALKMRNAGASVILLEKKFCGAGATGKSSGFITPVSEIDLNVLIKECGEVKARQLWNFIVGGMELIRDTIKEHRLECSYLSQDSLYITDREDDLADIKSEYDAQKSLGQENLFYDGPTLRRVIGSPHYLAALRYGRTFSINAFEYCDNFKKVLIDEGVEIYENSGVTKINQGNVEMGNIRVFADKIIVCADRFIPDFGKLVNEIYHVQTFALLSKPLSDVEILKIFPSERFMVWDTDLIYKYFRITNDNRLLVGGEDIFYIYSKKEKTYPKRFVKKILKYFKDKFPTLNFEVDYVWPGLMGVTKDLLPIVAEDKNLKNIYYVGGSSGLPWAAALGNYVAEKILQNRNDLDGSFSPDRKFPVSGFVQKIIGNKLAFAISHGLLKKVIM